MKGQPEAKCPRCKDRGWLTYDVKYGHPQFAKLLRCPDCGGQEQQESLAGTCGLPCEWLGWTFRNTVRHDGIAAAYDAAFCLAQKPQRFLTLLGSYGVGKTRLLACIVNEARLRGLSAIYLTTADLLDYLRAAYAPKAEVAYDERLDRLTQARVLCLDEFDRFNSTEWAREKFFQLVDARYQRGQELLTCFAANATLEDLPPYLRSRLEDRQCALFQLTGQDIRRRPR
jgi:DNA replication protein DnaC